MSLAKKYLFVNNKSENQSGGNIYNAKIMECLEKLGHTVIQTSDVYLREFKNQAYITILDSIIIDEDLDLDIYKEEKVYFLIHLWPSFNNDLDQSGKIKLIQKQSEICEKFNLIFAGENSKQQCSSFFKGKFKKHFIIPPGVPEGWKIKTEYASTATKFLMIGNLCERKRQLEVIDLFSALNYSINLTVVGRHDETNYSNDILQKINNSKGNLFFHNELEYFKMNDFILKYDAIISFSKEENNSIALIEGIASGIPIITTPTGNYRIYENHKVGFVLGGFEVSYLNEAIIKLHTDSVFFKQQCYSVRMFKVSSWKESSIKYLEL